MALLDQFGEFLKNRGGSLDGINFAATTNCNPFEKVNPALSRLKTTDNVQWALQPRGQLALCQSSAQSHGTDLSGDMPLPA